MQATFAENRQIKINRVRIWIWIWIGAAPQIHQKPVSIDRRLISWNIEFNFKWNQFEPRLKFMPRLKFFKFGLCVKKQKHEYFIYTWSEKAFKGTVVNRALSSLHVESLETTLVNVYAYVGCNEKKLVHINKPKPSKFILHSAWRDCTHNLKWPSKQRWQCPIYKTTVALKALYDQVWIRTPCFVFENWLFLLVASSSKVTCPFPA